MVERPEASEDPDESERLARKANVAKDAWQQTVEDMRAMAADREDKGMQTLTIPAGHTGLAPPGAPEASEWGLSFVIPGDKVDDFEYFYETGEFDDTGVYQTSSMGQVYIVVEHLDMESGLALFVAGVYEKRFASGVVRAATDRGRLYTHVKQLDGTRLGSFVHDDVGAFFPDPEEFYSYEA